jgi:hypothetical protein
VKAMSTSYRSPLVATGVIVYVTLLAIVYLAVLHRTQGHYTAPQDDPYIHLALAEHIARGHYGINTADFSSPSSSMAWPFLLSLLAPTTLGIYAALFYSVIAALWAIFLLALIVDEWPEAVFATRPRQIIAMIAFVLLANLVGLTLLGMEHALQVALAIACAAGICRAINGRVMPWWSIASAAVAPWVRYEDFTLTLAIGLILLFQARRAAALAMTLGALVPLVIFSLFLRHLGLPILPVSVLVKGGAATGHDSALARAVELMRQGVIDLSIYPTHWPLLLIVVGLLVIAWREAPGIRRTVAVAAAIACALHLLIGPFGWWYRYEVYIVIFGALVFLRLFLERVQPAFLLYLLGAIALSSIYLRALWETPSAAAGIYGQQYQMHRFVTDYYHGVVAVNDLGEVSFRHGDGYVLDLFGLASIEAARHLHNDPAWSAAMVREHDAGLVMIYPTMFGIPAAWDKIGELCLKQPVKGVAAPCVSFYSTRPEGTAALRKEFQLFGKTLPPQSIARPAL